MKFSSRRSPVYSTKGCAATSQPLATAAALRRSAAGALLGCCRTRRRPNKDDVDVGMQGAPDGAHWGEGFEAME